MEGSVADDLDVGGILESIVIHMATLRDAHFGEVGSTIEGIVPNLRYRWWDGDAFEAGATRESIVPNLLHPPRKGYTLKILATIEGTGPYLLYPFGQSDTCEVLAPPRKLHNLSSLSTEVILRLLVPRNTRTPPPLSPSPTRV